MFEIIDRVCKKYTGMGYQYGGNISSKKETAARQSFNIPRDEKLVALIDGTLLGTCKNGLAIGVNGLYWSNPWMTKSNVTQLSWDEFITYSDMKIKNSDLVISEGIAIATQGYFEHRQMLKLLKEIQTEMKIVNSKKKMEEIKQAPNAMTPPPLPM